MVVEPATNRQSGGPGGFGWIGDDAESRLEGSQMSKTAGNGGQA